MTEWGPICKKSEQNQRPAAREKKLELLDALENVGTVRKHDSSSNKYSIDKYDIATNIAPIDIARNI